MTDDGGVLGNLPRSRPGQRSEKRAGKSAAAASRTERSGSKAAARPKPAAGGRRAAGTAAGERQAHEKRQPASSGGDPVGTAIRGVAGLAATGARVANGVAREVLRRLPRR